MAEPKRRKPDRLRPGEVHAIVSLDLERMHDSARRQPTLSDAARESLAECAADAFVEFDA